MISIWLEPASEGSWEARALETTWGDPVGGYIQHEGHDLVCTGATPGEASQAIRAKLYQLDKLHAVIGEYYPQGDLG